MDATTSVPGTFTYIPAKGTVLGAGSQILSATFRPTDTADYATATATVTLTVNQKTPLITWINPQPIIYGRALSTTQLDATTSVPGAFTYIPPKGTVLGAGSQILSATLTPTDTADYATATATVTLTVNQKTPLITWINPQPIIYGRALNTNELNAIASTRGTFAYTPAIGTVLGAGSQVLSTIFTPSDTTDYTTATAAVTLTVNQKTPTITWINPQPIIYGTALGRTQLDATASVPGTFAYIPAIGTVLEAGSQVLSATFTPTDNVDYATATPTVTLTVNQKAPIVRWINPQPIIYGRALSTTQLDATTSVPGTFTYIPAKGTVLGAGSQILSATFTPTDTADYATATATVTLTVNQKTPLITWANPQPIYYGMALSAGQLDATASVPGTFAYTPANGAVLDLGSEFLSATFTPTDTADYTAATASTTLTIVPASPTINWPFPPAPFIYGTALSSAQLNATSPVPGSFVYTPGAGTVPAVGAQTITATFTPADTTDYTTATANVPLTVYSAPPPGPAGIIQHVVVIMQENRSFDNLFNGFPGADTAQTGSNSGTTVALQPVSLSSPYDVDHGHPGWWADWDNGQMDGFAHIPAANLYLNYPSPTYPYSYVPQSDTGPIWALAQAYTLADRMFQSNTGPSFVAHQYMIAGQSGDADENPHLPSGASANWGCDSLPGETVQILGPNGTDLPGDFPCFNYQTIADTLDAQGTAWRYYAPALSTSGSIWSAFDAIQHIRYGADWTNNVISPNSQILTDIPNGVLAPVTWVVPEISYSDHANPLASGEGPDWVGNIVNAIGESPFWNSTVILIAWDDWGGWYDHVPPTQVDNMGLGFRVPLIVVSPYAKQGYVSHQLHESGSFLHFTEEVFDLPSLGTRDAVSDDLSDCFDWSQTPVPFVPVTVQEGPGYFLNLVDDKLPPDDD